MKASGDWLKRHEWWDGAPSHLLDALSGVVEGTFQGAAPTLKAINQARANLFDEEQEVEPGVGLSLMARTATNPKKGRLLFHLARVLAPTMVLELGTSIGISAAYLAVGLQNGGGGRVVTLEMSEPRLEFAERIWRDLDLEGISVVRGDFDETLQNVLDLVDDIGLVHIDGNHHYEPTIRYFKAVSERMVSGVVILDDIRWSEEMFDAWVEIRSLEPFTIDLGWVGLVVLGEDAPPATGPWAREYQGASREKLIALLNDERARRAWAEKQVVGEMERTAIWRRRAQGEKPVRQSAPAADEANRPDPSRPLYPMILAGTMGAPAWIEGSFATVTLTAADIQLEAVDLVVVGTDEARPLLDDWLEWEARPPLILAGGLDPALWADKTRPTDVTVGFRCGDATMLEERVVYDVLPFPEVSGRWHEAPQDLRARIDAVLRGTPVWAPDGDDVLVARSPDGDPRKHSIKARIEAWHRHGLRRWLEDLTNAAGLSVPDLTPGVGVLLVSNRPERLAEALERARSFTYPRFEIVVGLHGGEIPGDVAMIAEEDERVRVLRMPADATLGECLNRAADATGARLLAKVDDDDMYGPLYLDEAVNSLEVSGADLVGKATYAVSLEEKGEVLWQRVGREDGPVNYVPGATFVMPRRTWERIPFAHRWARVDSTFVRGLRAIGGQIWSSSRYEFAVRRSGTDHTWEIDEDLLRAKSIGPAASVADCML